MVTAAELLKSLSTTNSETEGHVVIGVDRRVTVPESLKRIAVQFDHNVETVVFDCPRYWDGLDMSNMAVYVNYMRSDGYTDSYPVGTVTVDSTDTNIMHFNWLVSHNVTSVAGAISFLVCVKKTDSSGYETNHWNSELCQDMYVSPGMEADEQFIEYNQDLITQLLLRMSTVEKINVQASEMQNLLAQTEDAKEATEAARDIALDESDYIKNSYANAFKGGSKGEIIRVDDVSPIEHDVKCKVRGKNLFNINAVVDGSFGVYSINGNDITFNYATDYGNYFPFAYWLDVKPNTDYTISIGGHKSIVNIYGYIDKVFGTQAFARVLNVDTKSTVFNSGNNTKILIGFYSVTDHRDLSVLQETVSNIQIEEGSVVTEYEPYIDPSTVTITASGKNLLSYPYTNGETKTTNGITFTVNADRSVTATGTATADAFFNLSQKDFDGIEFVKTDCSYDSGNKYAYISITSGNTVNKTFYPQIEAGTVATEWECPAKRVEVNPSSDGTVNITSLSPNMTIFTDTPGVTIEAEYNRDTSILNTVYIGSGDMPEGYHIHINPDGSAFELPETDQIYNPKSTNPQSGKAVKEAIDKGNLKLIKKIVFEEPVTRIDINFDKPLKELWVRFVGNLDGITETVRDVVLAASSSGGAQYFFWQNSLAFYLEKPKCIYTFHSKEVVPYQWETEYPTVILAAEARSYTDYTIQGLSAESSQTRKSYSTRMPGHVNEQYVSDMRFYEYSAKYSFATGSYLEIWGVEVDE